jgi:hypothetical protein
MCWEVSVSRPAMLGQVTGTCITKTSFPSCELRMCCFIRNHNRKACICCVYINLSFVAQMCPMEIIRGLTSEALHPEAHTSVHGVLLG